MRNTILQICLLFSLNAFSGNDLPTSLTNLNVASGISESMISLFSDTLHYKVTADDHGFMCPFLTPMFMTKITKEGALGVQKDKDLNIWFDVVAPCDLTPERVKSILVSIGYMESIIHISTFP